MTGPDPLKRALRQAAEHDLPLPDLTGSAASARLHDLAYPTHDEPMGRRLLARTPRGLVRIAYIDFSDEDAVLEALAAKVSPRVIAAPRALDTARFELDEYFAGRRREFEVALDWQLVRGFGRRVLEATARVPYGSVSTYKRVATEAGNERAFRAAGNALGANPIPIVVPCHRILHSTGGLGGYTGGLERKEKLLALERGQTTLA
jgi:methylated-DNA-[protein]-cysteine S-methyltransferase